MKPQCLYILSIGLVFFLVACGASANLDVENCDTDTFFRGTIYSDGTVGAKFYDDLGYGNGESIRITFYKSLKGK